MEQRAEPQDFELLGRQGNHAADRHRQHADALRVARRIRIARVECRRERADRSCVRCFRLGLGGQDRRDEAVEGFGKGVELPARACQRQPMVKIAGSRHELDRLGQLSDRFAQQVREPQAGQQGKDRRAGSACLLDDGVDLGR